MLRILLPTDIQIHRNENINLFGRHAGNVNAAFESVS